ncbi:MAG: hypothetical protein M3513_04660 [Actinomycetota bacterium]|nr:hypothetical protein [Actinomycetota bacterium]
MRVGGGLGLTSVVVMLAGFTVIRPSDATLSATPDAIVDWYTTTDASRVFTGGYVEVIGILCFLPFAACLLRLLRRGEGPDAFGSSTAARRRGLRRYVACPGYGGRSCGSVGRPAPA